MMYPPPAAGRIGVWGDDVAVGRAGGLHRRRGPLREGLRCHQLRCATHQRRAGRTEALIPSAFETRCLSPDTVIFFLGKGPLKFLNTIDTVVFPPRHF